MTYQNFTPMEEWEIYFFEVQRKEYHIHLRDINEKKFQILLKIWCNTNLFERDFL